MHPINERRLLLHRLRYAFHHQHALPIAIQLGGRTLIAKNSDEIKIIVARIEKQIAQLTLRGRAVTERPARDRHDLVVTFTQDNASGTRTTLELCNEQAFAGLFPQENE